MKRPRSLLKDKKFRAWLIEHNIEPAFLLTLGTKSNISYWRNKYLKEVV
jgi:hypothetical protein